MNCIECGNDITIEMTSGGVLTEGPVDAGDGAKAHRSCALKAYATGVRAARDRDPLVPTADMLDPITDRAWLAVRVDLLNAALVTVRAWKMEHPEDCAGYNYNPGSILNAYREGDISFGEAQDRIGKLIEPGLSCAPASPLPAHYPVSAPDVTRLNNLIEEHSKIQRYHRCGDLPELIRGVIAHYKETATNALEASKRFNDDMVTYLRAMALVLTMTGSAATHREKEARLRGCIELIESGVEQCRTRTFDLANTWHGEPDLFRSDFPVRHWMDKVRELEAEVVRLKGSEKVTAEAPDCPF